MRVKVTGAPGFEDFEGTTTPDLHEWPAPNGHKMSVVKSPEDNEWYVFKSQYVEVLK